jgi:hypothetical protein
MVTMRLTDLRLRAGDVAGARAHVTALRGRSRFASGEELWTMLVLVAEAGIALVEDDRAGQERSYGELAVQLHGHGEPTSFQAHGSAVGHACATSLALRLGRPDEAREHLREGFRHAALTSDRPILALVAAAAAEVAEDDGRLEEGALLLGAAARLRGGEDVGNPQLTVLADRLRAGVGPRFDECYAVGRALEADAALALVGEAAS